MPPRMKPPSHRMSSLTPSLPTYTETLNGQPTDSSDSFKMRLTEQFSLDPNTDTAVLQLKNTPGTIQSVTLGNTVLPTSEYQVSVQDKSITLHLTSAVTSTTAVTVVYQRQSRFKLSYLPVSASNVVLSAGGTVYATNEYTVDPETGIVTFTNPITADVTVVASYDRVTSFHLSRPPTAVVSVKNKATNTVLSSSLYTFDPATGTVVVKTPLATYTDFEIVYDQARSALLLSQVPRTATISVSVDGTALSSSNYSYDTSTQKLSFVNYTLPAASTVTVSYQSRIILTLKSRVDSAGLISVMFNGSVLAPSAYTLDASAGTVELLTATVPAGQTRTAVVAYQVLDWVSDIYTIQKSDLTASRLCIAGRPRACRWRTTRP